MIIQANVHSRPDRKSMYINLGSFLAKVLSSSFWNKLNH